ncbi:hypothetical protein DFH28DRAFT_1099856 [Melampsora americana]|nr:hypothetical protein DFH28DRAFT_1099856 [Melampsora americana]
MVIYHSLKEYIPLSIIANYHFHTLIQLCLDLEESFQIIGGDMKDPMLQQLTNLVAAFVIGKGDDDVSQSGNENDDDGNQSGNKNDVVLNRAYRWLGAKGSGLLPLNRLSTIWTKFETIFLKSSSKPLLIAMIDLSLSRLALNYSELLRKQDYESCLIEFWKKFTKEYTPNNPIVFEWPYSLLNLHSKWLRKSLNLTACGSLEDHLKQAKEQYPETCFPWQERPATIRLIMKGEDQTIIETLSQMCTNFHIGQCKTMTHYGL